MYIYIHQFHFAPIHTNFNGLISGQSDIKKLRRENYQLRKEIWSLRDEYDRLDKLLRNKNNCNGNDGPMDDDEEEDDDDDDDDVKCDSCQSDEVRYWLGHWCGEHIFHENKLINYIQRVIWLFP